VNPGPQEPTSSETQIGVCSWLLQKIEIEQIGAHLEIGDYSSVSSAVQRIMAQQKHDRELLKFFEQIEQKLSKVKGRFDP
jgi:hypothetical protein